MQVALTSSLKNIYRKFLLSLKLRVPGCYLSFWLWILLSCLLLIESIAALKVEKYGQHGSWERLALECLCSSRNGVVWQTQRTEVSNWWRKNVLQNLVLVKGTDCRMFGVQICENFMKTESQNWGIKLEETSAGHQVQPPAPRQRQCRLLKCHMKGLIVCVNLLYKMRMLETFFSLTLLLLLWISVGIILQLLTKKIKFVFKLLELRSLLDSCYWHYNDRLLTYYKSLVFESRL